MDYCRDFVMKATGIRHPW